MLNCDDAKAILNQCISIELLNINTLTCFAFMLMFCCVYVALCRPDDVILDMKVFSGMDKLEILRLRGIGKLIPKDLDQINQLTSLRTLVSTPRGLESKGGSGILNYEVGVLWGVVLCGKTSYGICVMSYF